MKTVAVYCIGVLTPIAGFCLYILLVNVTHFELVLSILTATFTFIMMICAISALATWRNQVVQTPIYDAALEYEAHLFQFLTLTVNESEVNSNSELFAIHERLKYCQLLLQCRSFLPDCIQDISDEFVNASGELSRSRCVSSETHKKLLDKVNNFSIRLNKSFAIKSKA